MTPKLMFELTLTWSLLTFIMGNTIIILFNTMLLYTLSQKGPNGSFFYLYTPFQTKVFANVFYIFTLFSLDLSLLALSMKTHDSVLKKDIFIKFYIKVAYTLP